MRHLLFAIVTILLLALFAEGYSGAFYLLTYPSDLAVLGGCVAFVVTTIVALILLMWLVNLFYGGKDEDESFHDDVDGCCGH